MNEQIEGGSTASAGHTRRDALRVAAGVAWTVPAVTVLGAGAAHADVASGVEPGTTPPPTPPPPTDTTPPPPEPTATVGTPPSVPGGGGEVDDGVVAGGPAQRPTLARTGSEALPLAAAGLGLVAGGAALYAAARRDEDTAED